MQYRNASECCFAIVSNVHIKSQPLRKEKEKTEEDTALSTGVTQWTAVLITIIVAIHQVELWNIFHLEHSLIKLRHPAATPRWNWCIKVVSGCDLRRGSSCLVLYVELY